jgi:hypothetical protein
VFNNATEPDPSPHTLVNNPHTLKPIADLMIIIMLHYIYLPNYQYQDRSGGVKQARAPLLVI